MTLPSIVLGSPQWLVPAGVLFAVGTVAVVWSYLRWRGRTWVAVASCASACVSGSALSSV